MLNLRKRLDLPTQIMHDMHAVTHTDEYPMHTPTIAVSESFGPDFNLIRAVQENGPVRVTAIRDELLKMEVRKASLTTEMQTLERMIAATHGESNTNVPADENIGRMPTTPLVVTWPLTGNGGNITPASDTI